MKNICERLYLQLSASANIKLKQQFRTVTNQFEYEKLTSESYDESIHDSYNNEQGECLEKIKQIKEKNTSITEIGNDKDGATWLVNTAWCTRAGKIYFYLHTQSGTQKMGA